jgi:hypothetical protein
MRLDNKRLSENMDPLDHNEQFAKLYNDQDVLLSAAKESKGGRRGVSQ